MPAYKVPCPHCGQFIMRDVAICPFCQTRDPFAPIRCASCRTTIEDARWVVCPQCGTPVPGRGAAPAASPAGGGVPGPAAGSAASPAAAAEAVAPPAVAATPAPVAAAPAAAAAPSSCRSCGAPLAAGARFCTVCGTLTA